MKKTIVVMAISSLILSGNFNANAEEPVNNVEISQVDNLNEGVKELNIDSIVKFELEAGKKIEYKFKLDKTTNILASMGGNIEGKPVSVLNVGTVTLKDSKGNVIEEALNYGEINENFTIIRKKLDAGEYTIEINLFKKQKNPDINLYYILVNNNKNTEPELDKVENYNFPEEAKHIAQSKEIKGYVASSVPTYNKFSLATDEEVIVMATSKLFSEENKLEKVWEHLDLNITNADGIVVAKGSAYLMEDGTSAVGIKQKLPKGEYLISLSTKNDPITLGNVYETYLVYQSRLEEGTDKVIFEYNLSGIESSSGTKLVKGAKTTLIPNTTLITDSEAKYKWEYKNANGIWETLRDWSNIPELNYTMGDKDVTFRVTLENQSGIVKSHIQTIQNIEKISSSDITLNIGKKYSKNEVIKLMHEVKDIKSIGEFEYKVAYRKLNSKKKTIIKDYNTNLEDFQIKEKGKYKIAVYTKQKGTNKGVLNWKVITIK